MAPASTKSPTPSFEGEIIGNNIAVDGVGSPVRNRRGWEMILRYLEEEVHRLRCKGEMDKGSHEDGSRIDKRGEVVINRVEGVEEGLAKIDLSLTSI